MEAFETVDLYALPPEEFTAARDAQGPAFTKLRKPTVSAWVVNTLVRREPALLEQLLTLGADLAAAQSGRDAAALRTLGDQRRQLVDAVANRAVELVERPVSAVVRAEVVATLEAALADPPSAAAVVTGALVRALSFAGFGGVDLDGAVAAVPKPAPAPTKAKAPAKVLKLERAAQEAAGALDDAVRRAERVEREATVAKQEEEAAQQALRDASTRATDLRTALTTAEAQEKEAASTSAKATKAAGELDRKTAKAVAAVAQAQEAADAARSALDAARRG